MTSPDQVLVASARAVQGADTAVSTAATRPTWRTETAAASPAQGTETAVSTERVPIVLFACVHNAGRSVAAKVLTEHYAAGRVDVRSAGSEPGTAINPTVAEVLADRGLSTGAEVPTLLTRDGVEGADVVVTMGCGETCPVFPGKRYLDWSVADPAGQDRPSVERIVDDIDIRVRGLLADFGIDIGSPSQL